MRDLIGFLVFVLICLGTFVWLVVTGHYLAAILPALLVASVKYKSGGKDGKP